MPTKQENIAFFRERLPTLLAEPLLVGKFVVVHNLEVKAAFDTFALALQGAIAYYPATEFAIQQVIADDARISFVRAAG